ncbi:hypothetical protein ABDJ41_07405 [Pedobacter sp. ASV1-7]|uniref:hypothetical protein n=1 Tax=Pedobacter sp. ASV1-7 TaxID=3145237 RepID=UPI0032E91F82
MEDIENKRPGQITEQYLAFLDQHIEDVANGNVTDFLELFKFSVLIKRIFKKV